MNLLFKSPLCGEEISDEKRLGIYLNTHLKKKHNILAGTSEYISFMRDKLYPSLNIEVNGFCLECGKPTKFKKLCAGFEEYCSLECRMKANTKKRRATCLERYGVEHYSKTKEYVEKQQKTCLERYGVAHPLQHKEFMDKARATCESHYGVDNPNKSPEIIEQRKQTNLKRYGVSSFTQTEEYKEKTRETCLEKYGVDHHLKAEEVQEKRKQTWLEKYGVDNPNKNRLVRSKIESTNREKYGVSHPSFQLPEFTEKREKTWMDKYGYTHPNSVPGVAQDRAKVRRENHFEQFIQDLSKNKLVPNFDIDRYKEDSGIYSYHCNRCGNNFNSWLSEVYNLECPYCRRSGTSSRLEISLHDWLSDIGVKRIIAGDRKVIAPLELDFYLPDYNLAIEVDGLYWHSDLKKSKDYHLNKTLSCQEKGIRLIHFTDSELEDKPKICKSILFSALGMNKGVYARNCEVRKISSSMARDFCNRNHIHGYYTGANVNLGLYSQDRLLQVCTFGKSRFSSNETELLRHCSRLGTTVIGGFSKLIKYYVQTIAQKI